MKTLIQMLALVALALAGCQPTRSAQEQQSPTLAFTTIVTYGKDGATVTYRADGSTVGDASGDVSGKGTSAQSPEQTTTTDAKATVTPR